MDKGQTNLPSDGTLCSKLPTVDTFFLKTAPAEPCRLRRASSMMFRSTLPRRVSRQSHRLLRSYLLAGKAKAKAAGSAVLYVDAIEGS